MLKRSPSAHPRRLWIALSLLAVAALAGTFLMVVRSDGQGVGVGPAAPLPTPTAKTSASTTLSATTASSRPMPGIAPDDSTLVGGMTNHLDFARKVAVMLLTYDASTDFDARNADLLQAAAPTPYGNPTGLAETLAAYTPTETGLNSIKAANTTVTVSLSEVSVSDWAALKLAARGASSGVYGIDITATQTISTRSAAPTRVPVRMGLTVACPPAVEFCTLAGVFPQFVEDALGAG